MNYGGFLNFFQKIDLNEPEYVENYGDQFSAVQMIFYIAKKSIFINFILNIKNRSFMTRLQKRLMVTAVIGSDGPMTNSIGR